MKYKIILASNSPRRKELLAGLDFPFEVRVMQGIDESFPDTLNAYDTALYIARKKADAYQSLLEEGDDNLLVLTADTVVIAPSDGFLNDQECKGVILGKPHDAEEAYIMLRMLSGKTHHVVTGVCLTTRELQRQFSVVTEVSFKKLDEQEINYYVDHYKPFDKAGAYGIQEWIGYVGCVGLKGSYFNVMGLPVQRIYEELRKMEVAGDHHPGGDVDQPHRRGSAFEYCDRFQRQYSCSTCRIYCTGIWASWLWGLEIFHSSCNRFHGKGERGFHIVHIIWKHSGTGGGAFSAGSSVPSYLLPFIYALCSRDCFCET